MMIMNDDNNDDHRDDIKTYDDRNDYDIENDDDDIKTHMQKQYR